MSCKRCIRNSRILHRRAHACNRTTSLLIICTIDKTTRSAAAAAAAAAVQAPSLAAGRLSATPGLSLPCCRVAIAQAAH